MAGVEANNRTTTSGRGTNEAMKLLPGNIYHIYNRGNDKQLIFHIRENYLYFLNKIRKHMRPYIDIFAYCLMPNHFHFLVYTSGNFNKDIFSKEYKILLSSYTRALNNQRNKTGSLFQQNSRARCLTYVSDKKNDFDYGLLCFNYIHQNPIKARLVSKIENWEFSSFPDYIGLRRGTLCNKSEAFRILNLPKDKEAFYKLSYVRIKMKELENVF